MEVDRDRPGVSVCLLQRCIGLLGGVRAGVKRTSGQGGAVPPQWSETSLGCTDWYQRLFTSVHRGPSLAPDSCRPRRGLERCSVVPAWTAPDSLHRPESSGSARVSKSLPFLPYSP